MADISELRRRSFLQARILLRLAEQPAPSITELAERVGVLRPSASRAVHLLVDQGLVHRDHGAWRLTNAGQEEASIVSETVIESAERATATVARALKDIGGFPTHQVLKAIESMKPTIAFAAEANRFRDMLTPSTAQLAQMDAMQLSIAQTLSLANPMDEAIKQISSGLQDALAVKELQKGAWADAMAPLIDAQRINGDLISRLASTVESPVYQQLAQRNNLLMAGAIDNALALNQAEIARLAAGLTIPTDLSWISAQLADVGQAALGVIQDQAEQVRNSSLIWPSPALTIRLSVPPIAVTNYTGSLRSLVEAELEDSPPVTDRGTQEMGDEHLDPLLMRINPNWVEMRQGSWHVLNVGGPDRLRHAGTSQRSLIEQVLRHFVPAVELPVEARQGSQVKRRMKILLRSESDAEFVDAISKAVLLYYTRYNKFTHENMKHEESLRAQMRAGEGLLRFILSLLKVQDP